MSDEAMAGGDEYAAAEEYGQEEYGQETRHEEAGERAEEKKKKKKKKRQKDKPRGNDDELAFSLEDEMKGDPLEKSTLEYFKTIGEVLEKNEFEDEEERAVLVENVHDEARGNEYRLAVHRLASRTLERVLRLSTPDQLRRFAASLRGRVAPMCADRNASHVVQTLLSLAPPLLVAEASGKVGGGGGGGDDDDGSGDDSKAAAPLMRDTLLAVYEELQPRWADMACDMQATHLVRALIDLAAGETTVGRKEEHHRGGGPFSGGAMRPDGPTPVGKLPPHAQPFAKVLPRIARAVRQLSDAEVGELETHPQASPTLQRLLLAMRRRGENPKALGKLVSRLVLDGDWAHVEGLLHDRCGSHLVDALLRNAPDPMFGAIFQGLLRPRLVELSEHRSANFCVQAALDSLRAPEECEACVDELAPHVASLLNANRGGVVQKLAQASLRFGRRQEDVVLAVARGVGVADTAEDTRLAELLLGRGYMGSMIAQTLLKMPRRAAVPLYASFAGTDPDTLAAIACGRQASHALGAFLDSQAPLPDRRSVGTALRGHLARLASDRYGSYTVEKCFALAEPADKAEMARELAAAETRLLGSDSGRHVARKLQLQLFRRNEASWRSQLQALDKRRAMFKDILGEDEDELAAAERRRAKRKRQEEGGGGAADGADGAAGPDDEERRRKKEKKRRKKEKKKREGRRAASLRARHQPQQQPEGQQEE